MLRTTLIALILALPTIAVLNAAWFGLELRWFLDRTPRLASSRDLERFKGAVSRQMYAALVQIALLLAPPILYFVGVLRSVLWPSDVLLVIFPAAVVLLVAAAFKSTETRAKSIPAADKLLEEQRDAIVRTWRRKPVPDW